MTDETTPRIGTIMVIDDEEVDQMLFRRLIDRSDHVDRVLSFLNPIKALAHLVDTSTPKPDLILLDLNMPKIDGFEFLEEMAKVYTPDPLPVIVMLTTSLNPEDHMRAAAAPEVHSFKSKPLTETILREYRALLSNDPALAG